MKTNNFQKILLIFGNFLLLLVMLMSCTPNNNDDIINVVSPTKDFVVDDYIQSNMVLQKAANNYFHGTAEPNVKIIVDLINENNKTIISESTITDKNGNWEVYLKAPDNIKSEYTISIYDSFNKYNKTYDNILFGNVFVILGEQMFFNKHISVDKEKLTNLNICGNDGKWYNSNNENFYPLLTNFMVELYEKMENSIVGFINLTFESASLGSFINKKILEENSDLKTYNRSVYELLIDDDSRKHTYNNSEIYNTYLNDFKMINCHSVITYFGITDYYSGINFELNANLFAKSMSLFLKDLKNNFQWKKLLVIESPSISNDSENIKIDNIALLRNAQSTASFYNNGMILPLYELGDSYEKETDYNNFVMNLTNLVSKRLLSNQDTPSYANLIIKKDEIIIEINNCVQLEELESINNFKICNKNGDDVTYLYDYYIIDNQIIISTISKDVDLNNITILYNFKADICDGNLRNEDAQVVNPFIIILEGDK